MIRITIVRRNINLFKKSKSSFDEQIDIAPYYSNSYHKFSYCIDTSPEIS